MDLNKGATIGAILEASFTLVAQIAGLVKQNGEPIKQCLNQVNNLASLTGIPLNLLCQRKLEHNKIKYEESLCRQNSSVEKYTVFSKTTGVTKTENDRKQFLGAGEFYTAASAHAECGLSTEDKMRLAKECELFAHSRGWKEEVYTFNRLRACLFIEFGEMLEPLQWLDEDLLFAKLPLATKNSFAAELADITIYIMHYYRVIIG